MSGILAHTLIKHISPRCVCKPLCLDHLQCNIISLFSFFYEILPWLGSSLRMSCFLCFTSACCDPYILCFGNFCPHCTYMYISNYHCGKDVDFISYKSTQWKNQSCNYICCGRLSNLFATSSFMLLTKQSYAINIHTYC